MKATLLSFLGIIFGFIASALGGWSSALQSLVIFMVIDYVTGVIVAGVFNNSSKTDTGALNSNIGFKGILKKVSILLVVMIAYRLDIIAGTDFVKNSVVIAYLLNELLSITENLGLMGLYIPPVIKKAIDVLQKKEENR